MTGRWFVLVESNTTGTGRDFATTAARHGLRPVLLARDPGRYDYVGELGLPVREVDTGDPAAVEAACRPLDPAGVASSSEYFVQTAAAVAGRLGLPAPDPAAIGRCRNKAEQRRWLDAAGIPVPAFVACRTAAEVSAAATELDGPVVVKPVYGSGSQGVRLCADSGEATEWATRLLSTGQRAPGPPAPGPPLLVEREVPGPEFSVEIIDAEPVGVTGKHLGPPPYFVEIGHDYPAALPGATTAALVSAAVRAVRAIGHLVGPAHVELRHPPGGEPTIIEINPRLAGGLIPRLVQYATGRDLIDEVVTSAAGLPAAPPAPGHGSASIRFLLPDQEGQLADVIGLDQARELSGVTDVQCRLEPGARVRIEHSFVDRKGHVFGTGPDPATAAAAADRALARIRLVFADELAAPAGLSRPV